MKANELRIGNYLLTSKPEFNGIRDYPITKILSEMIDYIDKCKLLCAPIPLNEEWLSKCGFKYHDGVFCELVFYAFKEDDGFRLVYKCTGYDYGIIIQSLHQLQNLYFALTNEELKIEL